AAVTDAKEQADALAAIHFYSALAFHDCGLADPAKSELREFFRFHPGASQLDASKYPRGFVALFNSIQRTAPADTSFERFYRGFNEHATPAARPRSLALWGTAPEFAILA